MSFKVGDKVWYITFKNKVWSGKITFIETNVCNRECYYIRDSHTYINEVFKTKDDAKRCLIMEALK